ncbi:hypothetical protein HOM50_02880 [bacterium]|jgi:hypothetical protein|nr:hypothetical protein [bacterium]MBT5015323.1 hypothetical protein [bacterium]
MNKLLFVLIIGSIVSSVSAKTCSEQAKEVLRKRLEQYTPSERLLFQLHFINEMCEKSKPDPEQLCPFPCTNEEFDAFEKKEEEKKEAYAKCQELRELLGKCISLYSIDHDGGDPTCALALLRLLESADNRKLVDDGTKDLEESLAS